MEERPLETTSFSLSGGTPAPDERREGKRHLTLFRVGALTVDQRRELCLIKNISSGGMKIRPYCRLAEGTSLTIELKTGMSVPGTVAWVAEDNVGIAFDQPVDVLEVLAASEEGPRPRMPRVEIDCLATVRDGSEIHRVRVRDISQGGVKVELAGPGAIELGCDLIVTLPGLAPQPSVARWAEDGFAGITFNRLMALSELVSWLQEHRAQLKAA